MWCLPLLISPVVAAESGQEKVKSRQGREEWGGVEMQRPDYSLIKQSLIEEVSSHSTPRWDTVR